MDLTAKVANISRRLHIAVLTPWFPNRRHPQHGNFVLRCAELVGETHRVTLVAISDDHYESGGHEVEIQTKHWGRLIHVHFDGSGARTRVQRWLARRRAWQAAMADINWNEVDLIHAHVLLDGGAAGAMVGWRHGLPLVVTEHSRRYFLPFPLRRVADLLAARWTARRAAYVMPVSESLARAMRERGISGNLQVVPNVVNDALFHPATDRSGDQPFTFVHVSDFTPNKNFPRLLRAFRRLAAEFSDVRLHFAGNDHLGAAKRLAGIPPDDDRPHTKHQNHDQLRATGPHVQREIADLLRLADCFVLPSTFETQSIVLLEARLSGLPAIATRGGGPEDILAGRPAADLIDVGDDEALYQTMRNRYLAGPLPAPERRAIAQATRARYGRAATADALNKIYHLALSPHA